MGGGVKCRNMRKKERKIRVEYRRTDKRGDESRGEGEGKERRGRRRGEGEENRRGEEQPS